MKTVALFVLMVVSAAASESYGIQFTGCRNPEASCYVFNGKTQYVERRSNRISFSLWAKPTKTDSAIVSLGDGFGRNELLLHIAPDGRLNFWLRGIRVLSWAPTYSLIGRWEKYSLLEGDEGARMQTLTLLVDERPIGQFEIQGNLSRKCQILIGVDADGGCKDHLGNWFQGLIQKEGE